MRPALELRELRVLVSTDHDASRALALALEALGCSVREVASGAMALGAVRGERFELAICDLGLASGSGLDLVPELLAVQPELSIVVIAGTPSMETAAEAVRRGARDYLSKPLTSVQVRRLVAEERERAAGLAADRLEDLLELAVPVRAREVVRRAASLDVPVLVRGEKGTWKGAVARAIHERGVRRAGPFVEVSARTVRDAGELLGRHAASGGTLLLDEVGDLSRPLQEELLLLLQASAGAPSPRSTGVRVVGTTSEDLAARASAGVFRGDLLRELAVLEIELPPLRSRPRDILPLARAFAERFARQRGGPSAGFPPATRRLLVTWPWPGNVRELCEVVERAMSARPSGVLAADAFPEWMAVRASDCPIVGAALTAEEVEREHVMRVVAWAASSAEAARVLGMDPSTLRRKLRSWEGA